MGGARRGRLVQCILSRADRAWGTIIGSQPRRIRDGAHRARDAPQGVPRPDDGPREMRAALHAAGAYARPRFTNTKLRDALPVRLAVLPNYAGRQAHAVPVCSRSRWRLAS